MSSENFPTTLLAAVRYFEDEAVCRDFLAGMRWPKGIVCTFCNSDRVGFIATRSMWRCKDCRKQFSVKKGTIFEDSPIPLSKWLPAIWLSSAGKKVLSSHQLARDLGITQKSAWFMSHRIRLAMETESSDAHPAGEDGEDGRRSDGWPSHRLQGTHAQARRRSHRVSAADTKPPPSPPGEGQFRSFVTRLLRLPKEEIDARERARIKRSPVALYRAEVT